MADPKVPKANSGQFKPGRSGNPSGLAKPPIQRETMDAVEEAATRWRIDGWQNATTGMGVSGYDKRLGSSFVADQINHRTAMEMWLGDDLAAKAIESVPAECLREGYELIIDDEGDYGDLKEEVENRLDELEIDDALEEVLKYERAYGGGALLLGAVDGQEMDQPLDMDKIQSFDWVTPLEPVELHPLYFYNNPLAAKYGKPMLYQLNANAVGPTRAAQGDDASRVLPVTGSLIHESRLIVFRGIRVSKFQQHYSNAGWGASILTRLAHVLRDYNIAWASAGIIITDFSQPVLSLKNLASLVTSKGATALAERLRGIELSRSTARAMLIDTEESYNRQSTSVAGLAELLDKLSARLASAIDMPLTLLMGTSPGGLNATGDSDIRFYYDRIKAVQKKRLRRPLRRVLQICMRVDGGTEPKKWTTKFHPLWQQSDAEIAQTRLTVATTDEKYVGMGVATPEQIGEARFSGEYSMETQIDNADVAAQEAALAGAGPIDPATGQPVDPAAPLPAPMTPGAPTADNPAVGAAALQHTALNGAQVTSLVGIVTAVGTKQISRESGARVIMAAFQLSIEEAEAMLGPAAFKPELDTAESQALLTGKAAPTEKPPGKPPGKGGGGGTPGGGGGGGPDIPPEKPEAARADGLVRLTRAEIISIRRARAARMDDFNPDQPRGEDGRFGEGGGGATKGKGDKLAEAKAKTKEISTKLRSERGWGETTAERHARTGVNNRDVTKPFVPDLEDEVWSPDEQHGHYKQTEANIAKEHEAKAKNPPLKAPIVHSTKVPLPTGKGLTHTGDEGDGTDAPAPGQPFSVFRISGANTELAGRNAGNAQSVAMFIAKQEDGEGPAAAGGQGDRITMTVVTTDEPFSDYAFMNEGKATAGGSNEKVGRLVGETFDPGKANGSVTYSFPATGYKAEPVVTFSAEDARAYMTRVSGGKHNSFDDAGGRKGGEYLRAYAKELAGLGGKHVDLGVGSNPEVMINKGSLGIPRAQMPQIAGDLVGKFLDEDLRAKGTKVESQTMRTGDLKPTQLDLNVDKARAMLEKVPRHKLEKPIIVSSDNYILDGHHRWAALKMSGDDATIQTHKVDMPMRQLLKVANESDKVSRKNINDRADAREDRLDVDLTPEEVQLLRADGFNPDQPRDENGRFGEGGGGGSSSKVAAPKVAATAASAASSRVTAAKLPEEHAKYFKMKPNTRTVPTDKLVNTRTREGGASRAAEHMAGAYNGENESRDPISVSENPDGTFDVEDGNSTTAVAREHGWKSVPADIVEKDHGKVQDALKEISKLQAAGALPHSTSLDQHVAIAKEFLGKHAANLTTAKADLSAVIGHPIEGRTKSVYSALGKVARKTADRHAQGKATKYPTVAQIQDGTGMRAVLNTAQEQSAAAAAIKAKYEIMEEDNYTEKPAPGFYRAHHFVVRDKDGLQKEIQVQTKRQQAFQTWSHDVYKPQSPDQEAAIAAHKDVISKYAEDASQYLYDKDRGQSVAGRIPPIAPNPQAIKAFGKIRLDSDEDGLTLYVGALDE